MMTMKDSTLVVKKKKGEPAHPDQKGLHCLFSHRSKSAKMMVEDESLSPWQVHLQTKEVNSVFYNQFSGFWNGTILFHVIFNFIETKAILFFMEKKTSLSILDMLVIILGSHMTLLSK